MYKVPVKMVPVPFVELVPDINYRHDSTYRNQTVEYLRPVKEKPGKRVQRSRQRNMLMKAQILAEQLSSSK